MATSSWTDRLDLAVRTARDPRRASADDRRRFEAIETIRANLRASDRVLEDIDHGAGRDAAHDGEPGPRRYRRRVSELAAASVQAPIGRLFYGLVRECRPQRCLEMGTNLGVSGMYVSSALAANGAGELWTLDAAASSQALAAEHFERTAPGRVRPVCGLFDETLEPTLAAMGRVDYAFVDGNHREAPTLEYFEAVRRWAAPGGVIVFDDIHASPGMRRAWRATHSAPGVAAALQVHLAAKPTVGLVVIGAPDATAALRRRHLDSPGARILSLARRRAGRLWRRLRRA